MGPLDFTKLGNLEFAPPDEETFRCLALARTAGSAGGTLPAVMNAANEVAVAAFLAEEGSYLGIAECVEAAMDAHVAGGGGGLQPWRASSSCWPWTPGPEKKPSGTCSRATLIQPLRAGAAAGQVGRRARRENKRERWPPASLPAGAYTLKARSTASYWARLWARAGLR